MSLRSFLLPLVVFSALLSPLAAHADTTYTYTGQDFTTVTGTVKTTEFVSGYFTTSAPLADNLTDFYVDPSSFSFGDGHFTINDSNEYLQSILISTDSYGDVVDWQIVLLLLPSGDSLIQLYGGPENAGAPGDIAIGADGGGQNATAGVFTSVSPLATTPEPSSLVLLLTGTLGLAGVARRNLRKL